MKISRKWIASLAGIAVLLVVSVVSLVLVGGDAISVSPQPAQAAVMENANAAGSESEELAQVIMSADFAVGYDSVSQLKQAAEVVVRGEVVDVSYVDFNTCAYTKVTLKVSKSYKGGLAAGDEITIMEVGGIISAASINGDKFGPAANEDAEIKVKVLLDGAPLTKVGEKSLYFLGVGDIGVVPGTYYVPMGSYQGKFKIDAGVAKRYVPADMQGGKYTSLAMDEASIDSTVSVTAAE